MIGIVIVTHADLGQGLINAVELIAGKQAGVRDVGLFHGDGVDEFEARVRGAIAEVDDGGGVICMVDFLGGTPANTVLRIMRDSNIKSIAGTNMPMLLETVMSREGAALDELFGTALSTGKDSVIDLAGALDNALDTDDDDF